MGGGASWELAATSPKCKHKRLRLMEDLQLDFIKQLPKQEHKAQQFFNKVCLFGL